MKEIIPYSQHYRCYRQMINGTSTQAVLEYIFDEYLARARKGRSGEFVLLLNQVAVGCNLKWETAKSQIEKLEIMGLIVVDEDSVCLFREDVFVSLCQAFIKIKSSKSRAEFADALEIGDYEKLSTFGYNYIQNWRDLSENGEGSPISDNVIQNRIDVSKIGEVYPKSDTYSRIFLSKIGEMYPKSDIYSLIFEDLSAIFGAEEASKAIEDIYSGKPLEYKPIYFHILGVLTLEKLSKIGEGVIQNRITKINNNKRELTSLSSGEEIEDKQEKEDILGNGAFPDHDGISQAGSEKEKLDIIELNSQIKIDQEKINRSKLQNKLPFFTREESSAILQSIDLCTDRADKIFIFQVWDLLKDYFSTETTDNDGNVMEQPCVNPEGEHITSRDLYDFVLKPAFEETNHAVEAEILECLKGTFQVTAKEKLSPEDVDMIVDFPKVELDGKWYYQVNPSSFHDIHAQVAEARKPDGMKDSEYNDKYIQQIIETGDTHPDSLTEIEYFVYNFLCDYYQISEEGEVEDIHPDYQDRPYLSQRALHRYFLENNTITLDDFLSVLNKGKLDEGSLSLRVKMFSAEKIQKWNEIHKQESIIRV